MGSPLPFPAVSKIPGILCSLLLTPGPLSSVSRELQSSQEPSAQSCLGYSCAMKEPQEPTASTQSFPESWPVLSSTPGELLGTSGVPGQPAGPFLSLFWGHSAHTLRRAWPRRKSGSSCSPQTSVAWDRLGCLGTKSSSLWQEFLEEL